MPKIITTLRDGRFYALLLGGLLAVAHLVVQVPTWLDLVFFIAFVIVLGIPHGAIDHLIEAHYLSSKQSSFSLQKFLLKYLLQMLIYGLLWVFVPAWSLLLFLVFSAWHFGESDMQPAPSGLLWKVCQFLLGTAVLFFILLREPQFTGDLIFRITRQHDLSLQLWQTASENAVYLLSGLILCILLVGFMAQNKEPIRLEFSKILYFSLVLILIYFLPLLPAFALYFGGWHAQNTFKHMASYLGKDTKVASLWVLALPFTLVAMVFLGILGLIWWFALSHIDPLPVLFIFIAIITLPHLLVMHKMFRG